MKRRIMVEGNNGGSYVRIEETDREDVVFLEVGETCVTTISGEISVVALAAILTRAKEIGFRLMLRDYGFEDAMIKELVTL